MKFPIKYNCLNNNIFSTEEYSIVPIKYENRLDIMKWCNEQMYYLRQEKVLTEKDQENYFKNVVKNLFTQKKPSQILFSCLKNKECIGYGGLVHINWVDKNAEISFVMNTELEKGCFELHWVNFLSLIEKIGFKELNLHKIFTYAFDIRPQLYSALEKRSYKKEAVLKEHCFYNEKYIDVVIHYKMKNIKNSSWRN